MSRSQRTRLDQPGRSGLETPKSRDGAAAEGAKQSFLAAMSHELRTPLNAIIGFAEIMELELLGPMPVQAYRNYVRDILASSRHLLRIIEDVLEITNGETGKLVLAKSEADLADLVRTVIDSFAAECLARSLRVRCDLVDDLVIRADRQRLQRAIGCLVSNAIKFSEPGGDIVVRTEVRGGDRVAIIVADKGIGMHPGLIEHAFRPFVQLADNLARPFPGTGLGLPLARLLAELHGGNLHLDSVPGEGTEATLELPAY